MQVNVVLWHWEDFVFAYHLPLFTYQTYTKYSRGQRMWGCSSSCFLLFLIANTIHCEISCSMRWYLLPWFEHQCKKERRRREVKVELKLNLIVLSINSTHATHMHNFYHTPIWNNADACRYFLNKNRSLLDIVRSKDLLSDISILYFVELILSSTVPHCRNTWWS